MPLLVSLDRGTHSLELGAHDTVALTGEELHGVNGEKRLLAKHRHNRWMSEPELEPFVRLQIVGPLFVVAPSDKRRLGPYQKFATFDGVAYVEDRVFGFWDLAHSDWYVVDAGEHWRELLICFHPSG